MIFYYLGSIAVALMLIHLIHEMLSNIKLRHKLKASKFRNHVHENMIAHLMETYRDLQRATPADWFAQVLAFHQKFNAPIQPLPRVVSLAEKGLREKLIHEEVFELHCAVSKGDLVEIADALADIIYIALGTAIAYGIDLRPVFAEVHASNMRKSPWSPELAAQLEANGKKIPMGKILKPPGWVGPQIAPILKEQISLVMEAYDPADKRDKVVIE